MSVLLEEIQSSIESVTDEFGQSGRFSRQLKQFLSDIVEEGGVDEHELEDLIRSIELEED